MKNVIAAVLALLLCVPARAVQFHVPMHVPPRLIPADTEEGPAAWFSLGYGFAKAPGMSLSGAGGVWDAAWRLEDRTQFHLRGAGFVLGGKLDPFGAGRRTTYGFSGSLEADGVWAPGLMRSGRLYSGLQAGVTMLDVRDPFAVGAAGASRVEPGTAVSIVPTVPFGVLFWGRPRGGFRLDGAADVSLQLPGATFFTYGPGGPSAYESTRPVHADAGAGARLRLLYEPWRLALELVGRRTAGFGNNEPAGWGAVLLSLGAL